MANSTSVDSMTVIPDAGMSFEPTSTGGDNPSAGMGALPFDPSMFPLGDQVRILLFLLFFASILTKVFRAAHEYFLPVCLPSFIPSSLTTH